MEDFPLEPLKEFQKNINEYLHSLKETFAKFSELMLLSDSLKEIAKTTSSAIQSIVKSYDNRTSELLRLSSEAIKNIKFDIPSYNLAPMIKTLSTVCCEDSEEIPIKLNDDEVELINDIDSNLEPKKEKIWTFEKVSFLITILLTILSMIQNYVSDKQSSEQFNEISAKIEEHYFEAEKQIEENKKYQERIINLLGTIVSQLPKEENQPFDEESSSLSE